MTYSIVLLLVTVPASWACICFQTYATNLHNPLFMLHLPNERHKFLVAEQHGLVLQFDGPNKPKSKPFLNLKHKVISHDAFGDERGLLGMALAPDYKTSGHVYTCQTVEHGKREYTEVARYDRDGNELRILTIEQKGPRGNGGMLLFKGNEHLYIFTGGDGDHSNSQNKLSLLGKVLRIDVTKQSQNKNYSLPQSNPFINEIDALPEIYALGLMNPWRCSVDAGHPTTGQGRNRTICSDTGKDDYDEINIIEKGGNYGGGVKEGNECVGGAVACANLVNEKIPIYVYDHVNKQASLLGGYVYRGSRIPELMNKYIFGETLSASLMALKETPSGWIKEDLNLCPAKSCPCNATSLKHKYILSFAEDYDKELYILMVNDMNARKRTGQIYKIVPPTSDKVTCGSWRCTSDQFSVALLFATIMYVTS